MSQTEDVIQCENCGNKTRYVTIVNSEGLDHKIDSSIIERDAIKAPTLQAKEKALEDEDKLIEIEVETIGKNEKEVLKLRCNQCNNIENEVLSPTWDDKNRKIMIKTIKESNDFSVTNSDLITSLRRLLSV